MSNHPLRALFLENTMSRMKNCTTLRASRKLMNRNKILQCLSIQGLTSLGGGSGTAGGDGGTSSGASRAIVKDRFKTFNIMFEELHQKQSQWTVPDTELRESLRLAVAEVLLPAYQSFMKRFGYVFFSLTSTCTIGHASNHL
ncbi:exocyst complex component EXO70A1-like [Senna tora]|uniref:Exocyst subunit Exo70 family protein n=1 Tax=Senna tora TaxID=362788 RepID=A0A834SXL7_9FABA|nr:exocyst complex component EXO70A1-like [Senna tora]